MPLLAAVLYVADMSAGMARLEEIRRSRTWRVSVWQRRLLYACVPAAIGATVLVAVDQQFAIVFIVPVLLLMLGWWWYLLLPRVGVRIGYERTFGRGKEIWYIQSPYLRRQHLRDVFWLPRR
jgi:hypothetical protein